jgi:site-specific DNA recombinase
VEADPRTAPTIATIFKEYAKGVYSFKSLARTLNTRGLVPPEHHSVGRGARPKGAPERAALFTADTIKDIISNERYAGRVRMKDGRVIAGNFPALIDAVTYEKCERVRASQRFKVKREPGAGRTASPYLLSGLLRCSACGSTMSGHTRTPDRRHHEVRRTYTCYRRRVAAGCDGPTVPQEIVEADLLAVLRAMALPVGYARAVDKAVAARLRQYGGAQAVSVAALAERQNRLNEMYELGRIGRAEYDEKCTEIAAQQQRMAAPPAPLFTQQQQMLKTLVDEWDTMTADERKRLLGDIFDSVTATTEGVDRLEPCEDWRPYIIAALPTPVDVPPDSGCHRSGRRGSSTRK